MLLAIARYFSSALVSPDSAHFYLPAIVARNSSPLSLEEIVGTVLGAVATWGSLKKQLAAAHCTAPTASLSFHDASRAKIAAQLAAIIVAQHPSIKRRSLPNIHLPFAICHLIFPLYG